jgi:hypothetical protein
MVLYSYRMILQEAPGGSGGGGSRYFMVIWNIQAGGSGNTPPVSPSQGNPGGTGTPAATCSGWQEEVELLLQEEMQIHPGKSSWSMVEQV